MDEYDYYTTPSSVAAMKGMESDSYDREGRPMLDYPPVPADWQKMEDDNDRVADAYYGPYGGYYNGVADRTPGGFDYYNYIQQFPGFQVDPRVAGGVPYSTGPSLGQQASIANGDMAAFGGVQQPMVPIQYKSAVQRMIDNPGMEAGGFPGMAGNGQMVGLPNPAQAGAGVPQLAMNMANQAGYNQFVDPITGRTYGGALGNHPIEHSMAWLQEHAAKEGVPLDLQAKRMNNVMLPLEYAQRKLNLDVSLQKAPWEVQMAALHVANGRATIDEHAAVSNYRNAEAARQKQDMLSKAADMAAVNQAAMEQHENPYGINGPESKGSLSNKDAAAIRDRFVERMAQQGFSEHEAHDAYDRAYHVAAQKRNESYLKEAQQRASMVHNLGAAGRAAAQINQINQGMTFESKMGKAGWIPVEQAGSLPAGYSNLTQTAPDGSRWVKPVRVSDQKPHFITGKDMATQETKTWEIITDSNGKSWRVPVPEKPATADSGVRTMKVGGATVTIRRN